MTLQETVAGEREISACCPNVCVAHVTPSAIKVEFYEVNCSMSLKTSKQVWILDIIEKFVFYQEPLL